MASYHSGWLWRLLCELGDQHGYHIHMGEFILELLLSRQVVDGCVLMQVTKCSRGSPSTRTFRSRSIDKPRSHQN
jgi:hypothetical protein